MRLKEYGGFLCLTFAACALQAADHAESPGTDADRAADIADIYVFRAPDQPNRIVAALTFGNRPAPRARIDIEYCDRDVLYAVLVDKNADDVADTEIYIRYGRDAAGQCGVRFENVPGAGARSFDGRTETVFTSPSGLRAFSGRRDDPFFVDIQGFTMTLMTFSSDPNNPTGQILLRSDRDSFTGRNATAAVFEMDETALMGGATSRRLRFWATTARYHE
jgi:uncharacterized protein DUF4331